jgi:hypothetical protein
MKADRLLSKVLSQAGFVHFGRAPGGRYDPVCFDIRKRTRHTLRWSELTRQLQMAALEL